MGLWSRNIVLLWYSAYDHRYRHNFQQYKIYLYQIPHTYGLIYNKTTGRAQYSTCKWR